jgi:hypothetical protein
MGSPVGLVSQLVSRPERSLVRARAHRLHRVAIREPGLTRRLRRRVCVHVAAAAPQLTFDRLSLLMRHTLWSYRLDNRIEAPGTEVAALERLRDAVIAVTTGEETSPADPLLVDLGRIVRDLSQYDQTGEVMPWYEDAVRDAVAAEVDQRRLERAVAAGAEPPTAERYLEVASRNVNYRSFAYALVALTGDRLIDGQLRCLDAAVWHASRAVRLANDIRGAAQDAASGTLNVLGLRTAAGRAVTPEYAWNRVQHHVRSHDTMLQVLIRFGAIPDAPALALTQSITQSMRLYRRTDLR